MIARHCPHCQEEQRAEAAFCGHCGSKTPILVELNAAAQYIAGQETFVEFRISNLSFEDVTVSGMNVSLAGTQLPFGIHELSFPCVLEADKATGLDFRVATNAAGNQAHPLEYAIAYETSDGETKAFKGQASVMVQAENAAGYFLPGISGIPVGLLEPGEVPDEDWFSGFAFGEAQGNDPALAHVRDLKDSKGVLFWPVPMEEAPVETFTPPTSEPAQESVVAATSETLADTLKEQIVGEVMGSVATTIATYGNCTSCSAALKQQGVFCHDCGEGIEGAVATMTHIDNATAFCPHCQIGLADRFAHCPHDGLAIPFHLDINELSLYMHEVSTKTEFRFNSSHAEVTTLQEFDVALAEDSLQQGANRLRKNHECTTLGAVLVDALVYPREANATDGIRGCPPGDTVLHVKVTCVHEDKRYAFSANHEITVMKRNTDPSSIVMHLGDVINSGDGSAISTLRNKESNTVEMAQAAMQSDSVGDFIKKMKADEGLQFRPVKFFLEYVEELEGEIDIPRPIDWNPENKARLFFEREGRLRNYCLLAQSSAVFGRKADSVDVRLVEIEAAMKRAKESTDRKASASVVSRKQWHFTAKESGIDVTQLSSLTCRVSPGRALHKDAVIELGLKEYVEIPDVIGLEVCAYEPRTNALGALYHQAVQYLKACERITDAPNIHSLPGGYTLARRHSLAPEAPVDLPDTGVAEYYVMLAGWASIGAAPTSNIQIAGNGIADTHAHILAVGGYYFIAPDGPRTSVQVNGKDITPQVPYPLKANDTITLGSIPISFAGFSQMHLKR